MSLLLPAFPPVVSAASRPAEENVELTVVPGDHLLGICGKYLEELKNCRKLATVNRLNNPDRIYAGQKLAIPVRLLRGIPMDGVVTFVKGDAAVREKQGEAWTMLQQGDHVREGSSLRTGAASALEITFEDGSSIFQHADTALEFWTTRQGPLHLLRELYLRGGQAITRVRSATGREQRFIIRTPSAQTAMRGTGCRVSSDEAETTRSEVMSGVVGVGAMGRDVEMRENQGTLVNKGRPPLPPRELLPPPQVGLHPPFNKLPLEIRFSGIPGAAAYRILLTRDREGRDIVREARIAPGVPLMIEGIEDGPYYVQGMSIDDAGLTGMPSQPVLLRVRVNPLPPLLRSPVEGAEFRSGTAELTWLKVADAVGYRLQIAADREFTRIVAESAGLRDVRHTTKPLEPGRYFFRIRSLAADGYEGAWSDVQGFAVVPPPPVPPVEKPSADEREIRIRWHDLGPSYRYHCQVARDSGFTELLVDRNLAGPEITIERPDKPGTYFVRTSAIDATGYEGSFSPAQSFEVASRFPYAVLGLLAPLGVLLLLAL
jgi:hypothetical protein